MNESTIAETLFLETLREARRRGASDVHYAAGRAPVFRIDGVLVDAGVQCVTARDLDLLASALLTGGARERFERSGDSTISLSHDDGIVRAHAFRSNGAASIAVRLLPAKTPDFAELGLPAALQESARRRHGLVIVAGPTGSGKSTALAALTASILAAGGRQIITIEDPIEFRHDPCGGLVRQREVGTDATSFDSAVHGALRCDPDVIVVGEMREQSTMRAVLTAAETGHLVLSSLHTGDAAQTIDRIAGSFEGAERDQVRVQLAQSLVAIACMRLVRRSGRPGRVAAVEMLVANDAIRHLVRDGKAHMIRNVLATHRNAGMQTLEAALNDLVAARRISLEDAVKAASRPDEVSEARGRTAG